MGKRHNRGIPSEKISELLPGHEWLASQDTYDDGDTWPICPGRVAEYVHERNALVVRERGKEIGFIPVFANRG
jgi:hypothetical protein